jgi:hypothetical protein
MDLIDEQSDLFLIQRPELLNWHGLELLKEKYPDIDESIRLNKLYLESVIDELRFILGGEMSDEQLKLIFI